MKFIEGRRAKTNQGTSSCFSWQLKAQRAPDNSKLEVNRGKLEVNCGNMFTIKREDANVFDVVSDDVRS